MTSSKDIREYLDSKGLHYNADGENIILEECPFCLRDNKLYIEEKTGVWICWSKNCPTREEHEHRHWNDFKQELENMNTTEETVDIPDDLQTMKDNLNAHPEVIEYMQSRGISRATMDYHNIGVNGRGDIVFPHLENGKIARLKIRNMRYDEELARYKELLQEKTKTELKSAGIVKPTKWYGRGRDTLVNADVLRNRIPYVFVVEGMIDVLTAREMGLEYYVGVPSASSKQDEWIDLMNNADRVYICMDNDPAGQLMAKELADRVGLDKCYNIVLPVNDLNDLWTQVDNPSVVFQQCIDEAKLFDIDLLSASSVYQAEIEALMDRMDEDGLVGFRSGYDKVDKAIGGWRIGETTLFAGMPKRGKTTFLKLLAYGMAKKGTPVYYMSFETKVSRLVMDLVSYQSEQQAKELSRDQFASEVAKLDTIPLYWYTQENRGRLKSFDELEKLFQQVKQRYGIKFIVLDNLARLGYILDDKYKKAQDHQEKLLHLLDDMAKRHNVHIMVIHHIKKEDWTAEENSVPTMRSIKGSGDLMYSVDNIMLFHRKKSSNLPKSETLKAQIIMDSVRDVGEETSIDLKYNEELRYYEEL